MGLIRNFAMTPEEMAAIRPLPPGCGWMSCHLSEEGLKDLPHSLPPGSLLILDDRDLPDTIEPDKILDQLTAAISRLSCDALLLDFQRPFEERLLELAVLLQKALPCPVGVSESYEKADNGPVFLPLLPPHRSLSDYVKPWQGREIWLEVGPAPESARVTAKGTEFLKPRSPLPPCPHSHEKLSCHYGMELSDSEILFTLLRTADDLKHMTAEAETLGITRTIGLYQELF